MSGFVETRSNMRRDLILVENPKGGCQMLERLGQPTAAIGASHTLAGLSRRTTIQDDLRALAEGKLAH
jgi:hypothetical protein